MTTGIGAAPATQLPAANTQQNGPLPDLTPQAGEAGATGPAATPGAAVGAPAPDMNAMLAKGRWLGPLATVAGGALALWGFSKGVDGSKLAKIGGITSAIGGIGFTTAGFKAHGLTEGRKEGAEALVQMESGVQQLIGSLSQQWAAKEQEYQSVIAQLQGQGSGTGTGTATPDTSGTGTGGVGGTGDGSTETPGTTAPTDTTGVPGTSAPTAFNPAQVLGTAVSLGAAASPGGAEVAEAGSYMIGQQIGTAPFATAADAIAASEGSLTTSLSTVKNFRVIVLESGGQFYPFLAVKDENGEASPLPAGSGTNIAAWQALRFTTDQFNGASWQRYTWDSANGSEFKVDGQAGSASGGTSAATNTPVATGQAPVTGQAPTTTTGSVTGGGYSPASVIGKTFSVADATGNGVTAGGGIIQLQQLAVQSAGGLATMDDAAALARALRDGAGDNKWSRFVTTQGDDGKFYVYQASIVRRATDPLTSGASPLHIFGAGFAEYHDGTTWQAVADVAAA